MQQSRTRRLIAAAFIVGAIAALSIWFGRQLHQQLLNRALIAAIKKSDAAGVDTILAAGADPNTRDSPEKQESLLERVKHLFRPAATLEPTALILALQQRGPIREPGDEHPMPMQLLAIVKSLVARGADVSARDSHGDTPIGELYTYDHPGSQDLPRILETLLTAGESANPILNEPGALSPLYCAVAINDTLSVHLLLDHGANTEATDFHGSTPLMIACREDDRTGIVRMLLDHRANLNTTDHLGNTPLMEAAIYGRTANARLLLEHGAKVDARGGPDPTQSPEAFAFLEADGVRTHGRYRINPKPPAFATPLSVAQREGYTEIAALLKAYGAKQ